MALIPDQTTQQQAQTGEQQQSQTGEQQQTQQQSGPQRPDYVPEKFWDATKGEPRYEDMGKSYIELERSFSRKAEELKADVLKDLRKDAPAKPEDYKMTLPEGLVPEGVNLTIPDDDPLLAWWKNEAHKQGLSNDAFNAGIAEYVKLQLAQMPSEAEELKKLGERAGDRVSRVGRWMAANLSEKHFNALQAFVSTADGVEAIEALMEKAGEEGLPPSTGASSGTALTQADLDRMQKDPKYWDPKQRDPAFVQQVQEGYQKLYPGKRKVA